MKYINPNHTGMSVLGFQSFPTLRRLEWYRIQLTVFLKNCLNFLSNNMENCVENDDEYSASELFTSCSSSKTGGKSMSVSFRPAYQNIDGHIK